MSEQFLKMFQAVPAGIEETQKLKAELTADPCQLCFHPQRLV